jgi:magnesium and cobalt transporter
MTKDRSRAVLQNCVDKVASFFSKQPKDREALIEMLRISESRNLIDPDALAMIEGALQVSDMQARDIMVPRVQMIVIKYNAEPQDILSVVLESGHSRFPVIGSDANEILGILLAKDLLIYFADSAERKFNIKDMMRTPVFVPESKRLNVLLREFRSSRNHMAIVVDEYTSVSGLITIEDVIEEIVGNIQDEHDIEEEEHIIPYGRNRYTVSAVTPIDEFNEYFKTTLSDEEYDTIGGLILKAFGHVPKRGELLEFEGFNVKILRADQRRIYLMRMTRVEQTIVPLDDTS